VAVSLLKNIYAENDYLAQEKSLHYLKTKEGHDVDFAIVNKDEIEKIIEVKVSDSTLGKNILKFATKYNLSAVQLVQYLQKERMDKGISIIPAYDFLENLYL
jgi:predicted AAA+ superfamily ATPase